MKQYRNLKNGVKNPVSRGLLILISFLFIVFVCEAQTSVKYDSIAPYSEGLAAVKLNGRWGYIDENKKLVIPIRYRKVKPFSEGLAEVMDSSSVAQGYIDKTGKLIIPFSKKYGGMGDFHNGLAKFVIINLYSDNDKFGFIDKTGKEITPLYDDIGTFSEGFAIVKLNGKYGYIDETGKEVTPLKYDNVEIFHDGLAFVRLNGKCGLIDKTGKEVIPLIYSYIPFYGDFLGNFLKVYKNEKCGIIDRNNKEIIPIIYDEVNYAQKFNKGEVVKYDLLEVEKNGKYGLFDETGKILVPIKYLHIAGFNDKGYAPVSKFENEDYHDERWIDRNGNEYILGIDEDDLKRNEYKADIKILKPYRMEDNTKIYNLKHENNEDLWYIIDVITGRKIYLWYNFYKTDSYSIIATMIQSLE